MHFRITTLLIFKIHSQPYLILLSEYHNLFFKSFTLKLTLLVPISLVMNTNKDSQALSNIFCLQKSKYLLLLIHLFLFLCNYAFYIDHNEEYKFCLKADILQSTLLLFSIYNYKDKLCKLSYMYLNNQDPHSTLNQINIYLEIKLLVIYGILDNEIHFMYFRRKHFC